MKEVMYRSALAVAIVTALGSGNAQAQSTPSTDEQAVQLDQVSVTAQRREQQVQKTPLSLTVIAGPELERMQVTRVDDVKFTTPNIIIEQNTGTSSGAKIIMRGVGADESMFTNDPAVALYIDDVYIARQNGAMFDLYDVERIEVLRGPQGTLYGRNATGGAIRYISKKPTGEDRLSADLSVGNLGRLDGRVMFATRVGETLDVSAAVLSRNRDGILHDQVGNRDVNDQDVLAGRLALASTWGEASYATLSIDRLRERSTPAWATPVGMVDDKVFPKLGSFYQTRTDAEGLSDMDQFGVALTSETDFGSFSWRNILHYRTMDHHFYMDVDGTDQMRYHLEQDQQQKQRGYEAQFTSQHDGPFNWVAGVFAFQESNDQPTRSDIFARGATTYYVEQDTTAWAVYAQGGYDFSDRLTLTLGGRYSSENKDFNVVARRNDGSINFTKALDKTWTRPDWKVMLDYDFNDNIMGYASVTTGFKSGGYNGRGTTFATITPVDAETLTAYEVGVKTTLLDNRVRLNANYYRLDYDGIQLTAVNPEGVFVMTNATGALIQGIEVDLQAQVTRKLKVNASFGTIDGEYKNYSDANAAYFSGRSMKSSPDLQWNIGASYVQPLATADLVLSAQARYTDEYYQNQDTSRLIMTRANTEYNARVAYEPHDANWSVALWGKNLSNEFSSTGGFDIGGLGIGVIYPNVPRTYGVEFKYRFW
ncbi:TonB-dependent receptor [Stenotrophomonas koreensis]|uniref:TonB-dependent receptor n=1 Tax=Stenotrophomonas koreensis TaxID=266128 RepID=UPI0033989EDA